MRIGEVVILREIANRVVVRANRDNEGDTLVGPFDRTDDIITCVFGGSPIDDHGIRDSLLTWEDMSITVLYHRAIRDAIHRNGPKP